MSEKNNKKANRLLNQSSTYLLQHAYNPVNWYPWGEEALNKARQEDKPILLSIGYSACHWCHVMEHESFEDAATAEIMNHLFINIKVDREERPDLDEIYMKAVQMLTGHGGWPMTVFLTPSLKPFFAGTYFPPQDKYGMPSFKRILQGVHQAWTTKRNEVEESSQDITKHLSMLDDIQASDQILEKSVIDKSLDKLLSLFDKTWGGFGSAPKFPHCSSLALAMRCLNRDSTPQDLHNMVFLTLDKMASGGIHDQLGGGFARYSVDQKWLVPHFEKMLYDNALLIRNYLDGFLLTKNPYWAKVATNCLNFVLLELSTPDGGFYCSLDADSEGEEGKFYVWRYQEILDILGETDGNFICDVFGVSQNGNFEHGTNILYLSASPGELAKKYGVSESQLWQKLEPLQAKLLQVRNNRIHPTRDEKMLVSWSSLMISALCQGYQVLKDPRYLQAAKKCASFILENMYKDGQLLRTYGKGQAKIPAYLEDYAFFIQALLDLTSIDADKKLYDWAQTLHNIVLNEFWDKEHGGFYFTAKTHEKLIARSKLFYDGSTPSPTSVSVFNLLRFFLLTGDTGLQEKAQQTIKLYYPYLLKAPDQFSNLLCALDFSLAPASEIIVVLPKNNKSQELLSLLYDHYLPDSVIFLVYEQDLKTWQNCPSLLKGKTTLDGKPTIYICHNQTCQPPIIDGAKLKGLFVKN